MTCDKYKQNISAWLDGELKDKDYAGLIRHMKECPSCKNEFEEAQVFQAAMNDRPTTAGAFQILDDMWERIEKNIKPEEKKTGLNHFFRYAAAAAAVVAITVGIIHKSQPTPDSPFMLTYEPLSAEEELAVDLVGAVLIGDEDTSLDAIVASAYTREAINQIMTIDDL